MRDIDVYEDVKIQSPSPMKAPQLFALCRTLEQVQEACRHDVPLIYADFEFLKQLPAAIEAAHVHGKQIAIATPRIHMPGETRYLQHIAKLKPDSVLLRNTGAVHWFTQYTLEQSNADSLELIGDFSLNAANHKAIALLKDTGLRRVTPSYDLNIQQMVDLLAHTDSHAIELVLHQHLPMYHTEHCVYCTFLSPGTDYTNCGRPCEKQRVSLRDRMGFSHPVRVDEGCRNTVYNAIEQSGAEYIPNFLELGVTSFRVEFLEEDAEQVGRVIELYNQALRGEVSGTYVWRTLKATNQLGVTRGQLVR